MQEGAQAKFVLDDSDLVLPRNDDPGIGPSGLKELPANLARWVCFKVSNDRRRDFTETVDTRFYLRRPACPGEFLLGGL